jgi:hypothetical protein
MNAIRQLIIKETEGLPVYILDEVLDFIRFIKNRRLIKAKEDDISIDSLQMELSKLSQNETTHLEEEFKNYEELYPYEE